jgi:LEA14-like dessication related protein
MIKTALLLVVLNFLLVGCGDTVNKPLIGQPTVSVNAVKVQKATLTDAEVLVTVGVKNPNPFRLTARGLDYDLSLNGRPAFHGKIDKPIDMPAAGSSQFDLPIRFRYLDIFSSLQEMRTATNVPYQFKGNADFGLISVPFQTSGQLAMPRIGF